jgi:topoisomerase-4 subunit A
MGRGKGVRLQKFREGGLADMKVFALATGFGWQDSAGRTFTLSGDGLKDWMGNRSDAGYLPPRGFPKNNRFP